VFKLKTGLRKKFDSRKEKVAQGFPGSNQQRQDRADRTVRKAEGDFLGRATICGERLSF